MTTEDRHLDITTKALTKALVEVFGMGKRTKQFVDISRVPLLCKKVIDIREDIKDIRQRVEALTVAVSKTVQKDTEQDKINIREQEIRDKWADRLWMIALNGVIATVILILIRTNIINLK